MGLEIFSLEGKVALVTGATRGLGQMMAEALAEAGADVALTSRDADKARKSAEELAAKTGRIAAGLGGDVTVASQVQEIVDQTLEKFGRIDILINNAGTNIRKPLEEFDEESWNTVQDANLKAPYLVSKAVAKVMKRQRSGRIINMASMLGMVAMKERLAYCTSKGGLIQMTKVLALELAPYNIMVNALCPGPFATELNTVVIENPEANKEFIGNIALGRWGDPKELAGAVIYLASDASSFTTGSAMVVDGGWTAH